MNKEVMEKISESMVISQQDCINFLENEVKTLTAEKDLVCSERNKTVAVLASILHYTRGANVYRAIHVYEDLDSESEWKNILVIECDGKQLSWNFHDSEYHMLEKFPLNEDYIWDGHTAEEKYENLLKLNFNENKQSQEKAKND